ncbi:hypothetical protein Sjap_006877 [Stephania japonica]|uniref:Condensin-2 complex subunit H2 n=1 Tax=Stephania japonica TaxID=461633 RepID=A0AAP0K8H5_9MAGN
MRDDSREDSDGGEGGNGGRFHIPQPLRDPQSNWAVDVAKHLEEYLLKICSGEVSGYDDGALSVNFAEAALLLQGSVQVYSRKVEYLYSLVLHALEFISQNRQQNQAENASVQPDGSNSTAVPDEENEPFLDLDDVTVEAKNCLDAERSKDVNLNQFVKPPANLVVLEGDCLDTTGEVGELESYLLALHDMYRDFILLDSCDVGSIQAFLNEGKTHSGNISRKGSSVKSKSRKTFAQSPTRRSTGSICKSAHKVKENVNIIGTENYPNLNLNDDDIWPDAAFPTNFHENDNHEDGTNGGYEDIMDDSDNDNDDPLKPLNPHEPGNLRVKPYKKVKICLRQRISSTKSASFASQFPVAKLHGTLSSEFMEVWEAQVHASERKKNSAMKKKRLGEPQSPPLYEKLRQSLVLDSKESANDLGSLGDDGVDDRFDDDDVPDFDMPDNSFMDVEPPVDHEKNHDDAVGQNGDDILRDNAESHENLEDLCRSHLDALLASIAETQKQTELAARVSTWKQQTENALREQDSRPPFDIHEYGDRILNTVSQEAENKWKMSFTDVVRGQEKHDVARTFSALLQLVNNRDVDLERNESCGDSVCHTAVNPFHVQLINPDKKKQKEVKFCSSKKRSKSPSSRDHIQHGKSKASGKNGASVVQSFTGLNSSLNSPRSNGRYSVRLEKVSAMRYTPQGKRRRRSGLVEHVDLPL